MSCFARENGSDQREQVCILLIETSGAECGGLTDDAERALMDQALDQNAVIVTNLTTHQGSRRAGLAR